VRKSSHYEINKNPLINISFLSRKQDFIRRKKVLKMHPKWEEKLLLSSTPPAFLSRRRNQTNKQNLVNLGFNTLTEKAVSREWAECNKKINRYTSG
jgi:hypothetical protein